MFDRCVGIQLLHLRSETTTLNHKAGDHTVENQAIVMALFDVMDKVGHRDRRLVGIQLQLDGAEAGVQAHLNRLGQC